MDIEKTRTLLPEFASGLLDEAMMSEVKAMVERHPDLQKELAEIESLFESTGTGSIEAAPDGYFNSVWPTLYKTIREEGLHEVPDSSFIAKLGLLFHRRTFQFASVPIAALIAITLYFSTVQDQTSPHGYSIAKRLSSSIADVVGSTSGTSGLPDVAGGSVFIDGTNAMLSKVEKVEWSTLLDEDTRAANYDSFTDFMADLVITMNSKNGS